MVLSVIVTSYESPDTLRRCLESLCAQTGAAEIVVSDCSRENPASTLQARFPTVRFLHFTSPHSVPQLRWAALPYTTGQLVAATEARCIPSKTWCRELLEAHAVSPECPAVGGTVALGTEASRFEQALYLCEYGAYALPIRQGAAAAISGANLSYRRQALQESADLLERGKWETLLHQRWVKAGRHLWQCGACVTFQNSMSKVDALRQRWHYGRGYAADRVQDSNWLVRIGLAAASIGLPCLLSMRIGRDCAERGNLATFAQASGWIFALTTAWSCGEAVGYLAGKPATVRIF